MAIDKSIQQRFWKYVDKRSKNDCWEWTGGRLPYGYGVFTYKHHQSKKAHRVAYCVNQNINIEDIDGSWILHSCDNPPCVNPKHLRLGTPTDNIMDSYKRNRRQPTTGTRNGNAKFTEADVVKIRALQFKIHPETLAEMLGVSYSTIADIWARRRWKCIA